MSHSTYIPPERKPLYFLSGQIKTPPFSTSAREEAGDLLRSVQEGNSLGMPLSRPLPSLGRRCHELRVNDEKVTWRIIYRVDADAVLVCAIFAKRSAAIPKHILDACRRRLSLWDASER
jgi:phage-related protein